jgi:hypothetical protein
MAETRKVLGQLAPTAGVTGAVYTVGPSAQAVISTITVCNTGATEGVWRVSIAVGGTADDTRQYIYYGIPVAGSDSFTMTEGYTLNSGDEIRCFSTVSTIAFSVFGVEIT